MLEPNQIHFRIRGTSMKVLIVLFSVVAAALASLEPAGYHPLDSSHYLPPNAGYQQDQHYNYQQHQSQHRSSSLSSASKYLTPGLERAAPPSTSFQYLPPRMHQYNQLKHQSQQQYHQKQETSIPSTNYLTVIDKQRSESAALPNAYSLSASAPSRQHNLANESTLILNNYLPPSVPSVPTPVNEYLPSLSKGQSMVTGSLKSSYLPPLSNPQLKPNSNYLPPSRYNTVSTTAAPRISSISGSSYKFDGLAYSKPEHQSKFDGTSSFLQSNSYTTPTPSFELKNINHNGFNQPANNYLPPIQTARDSYDTSQIGYRYSGASSAGARVEPTEEAKYNFEYRVSDEFGNDYAHKESRLGNQIQGVYSVLLPDGRKQIVHYEANEDGFKPRISYEEVASVLSSKTPAVVADAAFTGYNKNNNGLSTQGPY